MNKDIEFLKELQQELKTQENDGNASPVFWSLMDYRTVPTHEDYGMDRMMYYYNDGDHIEFDTVEELKEYLTEYYLDEDDEYPELKELVNDENIDFEDLWEYVIDNLNENGFYDSVPVKEEEFIVPNTMFLTKSDAKRHIELNHYHYTSKVHTYAMTAWRSPKVERLLKVLETFDWDSLEYKEESKIELENGSTITTISSKDVTRGKGFMYTK